MSRKINRREFLYASAASVAGIALTACAKPQTATPAAAAPTSAAPAALPPTTAPTPRPSNTPIPTKPPATLVPTAVPAKEAPMLAELVKAGKLPPLADRLPKNPLTLKPLHKIGKYGGTMRMMDTSLSPEPQDMMYGPSPLRWVDDGLNIAPGMCDTWETNADNSEWTVHIREGLKWSDGNPCTVEDVLFAWQDLVMNPDQSETATEFYAGGGAPVDMIKQDEYTLLLKYVGPAPLTAKRLAMWTKDGRGACWIAPKHYLMQFHPTYNTAVKDYTEFDQKYLYRQNPDCPTLAAWSCQSFEPGSRRVWVRNPYYYCVDSEGNQLPYIDRLDETCIADKEVRILTILQGSMDYVAPKWLAATLADIAPLKAGEKEGKYRLTLLDTGSVSHHYYWNYDQPDPRYRALYRNPKFKIAFNYLRDRARIQKVLDFGMGELTTGTMSPKAIEFNFNDEGRAWYKKWRDSYIEFDVEKAKGLLAEIGLKDVDGDGYLEFEDGSKLELRCDTASTATKTALDSLEIAVSDFARAGLKMVINSMPPAEYGPMWRAGQGQITPESGVGDGPDCLVYPIWLVPIDPSRWAPLCGNYYVSRGQDKATSEKDVDPWKRTPPRWLEDEKDMIGEPLVKLYELLDTALAEPDAIKRMQLVWQMIQIHIDQGTFGSSAVANLPAIFIYGETLINAPAREDTATGGFTSPAIVPHPAIHNPETFSFA